MSDNRSIYLQIVMNQMAEHAQQSNADASLVHAHVRDDFAGKAYRHLIKDGFCREIIPNPDDDTLLLEVWQHHDNASMACDILRLFDFSTQEMLYAFNAPNVASRLDIHPIDRQTINRLETDYGLKFENGIPRLKC